MKIQILSTILAINSILAIAGNVFAAPTDSATQGSDIDTAALSRAIAGWIDFEDDGISLIHVAIDRALIAKQMAGGGVDVPTPIPRVTAGVPMLPQTNNQDKR